MPPSGNKKRGTFIRVLIDVNSASGKERRKNGLAERPAVSECSSSVSYIIDRATAFMSDPPQEHRVYAAVIDREAVQSLAEVGLFAYEARLIASSTTQIIVNRFAKHYYEEEKKKVRTIVRSRLYKILT